MATKITYNGKTTDVPSGYIATIPCKDLKMETDVVVEAPEGEGESANLCSTEVTPTKDIQNIVPEGDFDGFDEVIVNPIPDEYIIPSGDLEITENGTHDVTDKASVTVAVPEPNLISKTITENGIYRASEEVDIVGTWVFNDSVVLPTESFRAISSNTYKNVHLGSLKSCNIYCTRNAIQCYIGISVFTRNIQINSNTSGDYTEFYNGDLRGATLILNENVYSDGIIIDEKFLPWLKANATKISDGTIDGYSEVIVNVASEQVEEWDGSGVVIEEIASASLISFTIDGTSYQAEDGMTWDEWGASAYDKNNAWDGGYFNGKFLCKSGTTFHEVGTDFIVDGQAYKTASNAGGGAD